jgi:hypothetical protein
MIDHGLSAHGQKMLVGDLGERKKSSPRTASQNYAFHLYPFEEPANKFAVPLYKNQRELILFDSHGTENSFSGSIIIS